MLVQKNITTPPYAATAGYNVQQAFDFQDGLQLIREGQQLHVITSRLLEAATRSEKLWMLDGDEPFWQGLRGILFDRYNRVPFVMGAIARLKVPGIRFTDGPRGIVMNSSTCFPVAMARGASWDTALEQRIGNAIGLEGRAQGANLFAGICINLPRHPAWGRIQETYGEDPILLGAFGVALHRGVRQHLMTCVKHFALNSMENARFKVDVQVDDAALHEVYLPHFRRLVEDGVSSVMSSYNSVRGEFAGENHELLESILRQEWGFDGFVISDFIFGLRDAAKSVKNGLDLEAPFRQQRALHLSEALERGDLAWSHVDRACARQLRKQLEHAARLGPEPIDPSIVFCEDHRNLAREAAAQGMTLLKNNTVSGRPVLPLDSAKLHRVAIVGRLANTANTGDKGSSAVFAPKVVTFYEGLKTSLPNVDIALEDTDDSENAAKAAISADVTLCIVGYGAADEGEYVVPSFQNQQELLDLLPPAMNAEEAEVRAAMNGERDIGSAPGSPAAEGLVPGAGGDRKSLRLRDRDVEIIKAVSKVSAHVVVIVVAAGAVLMNDWLDQVPSVLMAWYSGCEGGHALSDVLLGHVDASGRLPFSIPQSEAHLPHFDINATSITYDRWFGQSLLDKLDVNAQFPLGYGLSYTTFDLEELVVGQNRSASADDTFTIRVKVVNTGSRAGRHVVQVYGKCSAPDFPTRVLLGFRSVALREQSSADFHVVCSVRPLTRWVDGRFIPAAHDVCLEVATYAGDPKSLRAKFHLRQPCEGRFQIMPAPLELL